jgi:hypothetical protein
LITLLFLIAISLLPIEDRRMHYRHLYYFVRIVEAGSFSQAARTTHVAQPALSQQIAELEASLGVPLLQRSARGVRRRPPGKNSTMKRHRSCANTKISLASFDPTPGR